MKPFEHDIPGELSKIAGYVGSLGFQKTCDDLCDIADAVELELARGKQLDAALRRILNARPNSMEFWESHRAAAGLIGLLTKEKNEDNTV